MMLGKTTIIVISLAAIAIARSTRADC